MMQDCRVPHMKPATMSITRNSAQFHINHKEESMRIGFTMTLAMIISLSLTGLAVFANERPGPKGSVGGGSPSAGKGVPQMQSPVDPMQHGGDAQNPSQPGSGQGTQNPKEGSDNFHHR